MTEHLSYPDPNDETPVLDNGTTPTTTSASIAGDDDHDHAGDNVTETMCFVVLLGLIMIFTTILCCLTTKRIIRWMQAKLQASPHRIQRRYETIEGWLISKRVRAHGVACDTLNIMDRHCPSVPQNCTLKQTASNDTAETILEADDDMFDGDIGDNHDNYLPECPVCMECFVKDEIVSWSPSWNGCDHVFHHECIKEWLLHKDTCPYCRVIFLPVDNVHRKTTSRMIPSTFATILPTTFQLSYSWTQEELQTLAEQRSRRLKSTYFCIQDGLVTIPSNHVLSSTTPNNSKIWKQMISSGGVERSDLEILRGSRATKVKMTKARTKNDVDGDDRCDDISDNVNSRVKDENDEDNNNKDEEQNRHCHHDQRQSNDISRPSMSPQVLDYSFSVEGDIESCLRHQIQTSSYNGD